MKKLYTTLLLALFLHTAVAQVTQTANVIIPGTLSTIASEYLNTVTNLTVTGTIDERDFETMNKMTALSVLDLSTTSIVAYTKTVTITITIITNYPANTIPQWAFVPNKHLTTIALPNNITGIGNNAFNNCTGLTSVVFPNSLIYIDYSAFHGCTGLTSIIFPNSLRYIYMDAFTGCSGLSSINFLNSETHLEGEIFLNTAWFNNQPDGVIYIGKNLYGYKGIMPVNTNISVQNGTIYIDSLAFISCTGLASITIPNSVTSIGGSAFVGCSGLTSISIPNSVTYIGCSAFYNCSGLTSIYVNNQNPANINLGSDIFSGVSTKCTLYVPSGTKSAYQAANQWKDFTNIIEMTTAVPTFSNTKVNLYPNPMIESFQISGIEGTSTVSVYDLNGKTLFSKQVMAKENISVATLPKGIYIAKIITSDTTIERKIVKE